MSVLFLGMSFKNLVSAGTPTTLGSMSTPASVPPIVSNWNSSSPASVPSHPWASPLSNALPLQWHPCFVPGLHSPMSYPYHGKQTCCHTTVSPFGTIVFIECIV